MKKYPTIVLAKDSKKHNVTNHEIHGIVFKIVLEIDRICRKRNIPYALAFGSALGLAHYGDFIPWDDDADIAINYFDLPRFIEALKEELSDQFSFSCFETNDKYNVLIPTMKIRFKKSFIEEKTSLFIPNRCDDGNGIFVDVVCLMGVPEARNEHKKLLLKSKLMMPIMCLLDGIFHINPKHMKKSLKKYEAEIANKYKDSEYVSQTVIIPFQELPKKIVHSLSFPKDVIYPFKEYDFRGHKIYSFADIEKFSFLRYGEFKENFGNKSDHLKKVDIF